MHYIAFKYSGYCRCGQEYYKIKQYLYYLLAPRKKRRSDFFLRSFGESFLISEMDIINHTMTHIIIMLRSKTDTRENTNPFAPYLAIRKVTVKPMLKPFENKRRKARGYKTVIIPQRAINAPVKTPSYTAFLKSSAWDAPTITDPVK